MLQKRGGGRKKEIFMVPHKSENDIFTLGFYFRCYRLKPIWLIVFYLPKKWAREGFPRSPESFEEQSSTKSILH